MRPDVIPGMRFDNVREHGLRMDLEELGGVPEIPRRRMDAGALPVVRPPQGGFRRLPLPGVLLTGDAAATDPVCELSPMHGLIEDAVREDAGAAKESSGSAFGAREAPFHVLQEKMDGFWSYRSGPEVVEQVVVVSMAANEDDTGGSSLRSSGKALAALTLRKSAC